MDYTKKTLRFNGFGCLCIDLLYVLVPLAVPEGLSALRMRGFLLEGHSRGKESSLILTC